ncbi:MAG: histidine kinase, partial [Spirosomaceae bacterium]|nr:histidine kinase [Spirosomataceae bacterium]
SLAAYILFTAELLDIRQNYPRLFKVMKTLAAIMILQGIVEVFWLLITFDIAGYEKLLAWSSSILFPVFIGLIVWMSIFVRHHLVKYVTISNGIFVSILLLTFLRSFIFTYFNLPVYLDSFFKLPFATLLEMVVFSFAIAAKISYDNNLRVMYEKQLRETEMMALRSQMNPHFIFNSLNTIRNFILQNDNGNANKYLAKFSKLLRQILSYSRSNTISLADEIETVKLYLELESARFKSGFHYEIILSPDLDVDAIRMPPLLLQPYAENAIWHGLRHSNREEKAIWLTFSEEAEALKISIKDNGIGRKEAAKFRSETKDSLGTKITEERIELFNQTENSNILVETIDSPQGTEVILMYRLN